MSLSLESKHKVLYYLCYAGKTLIEGSTHYNSVVISRLTDLDSFIEDQVDSLITQLDAARTKLNATQNKGNVKRIGDIELDTDKTAEVISNEYKRLQNELSTLLDIPNKCRSGSSSVRICGP